MQNRLLKKYSELSTFYREFQLHDLGSLAINRLTPRRGYTVRQNIAYGLKARQRLDLYLSSQTGTKPLIVFVHGGSWQHGDKRGYRFAGEAFTRYGYDVAVINYHLAPEHRFPGYVDDVAAALNFLDQQQGRLGISTERIALIGHSAGAFNIASLLYHPRKLELNVRQNIRTMIGIAGPYHFDYKGDPLAEHAFDPDVPYQQVMPCYFVEKNHIQHYLFLAEKDRIVKDSNALDLQQKLVELDNHCEIRVIPGTGHVSIMGSLSSLFSRFFSTRSAMIEILDRTLKVH
ncbi:alpha/beta hydrolase [Acinetobacter sp. WZC-1]|uniref:alpha/beta hydrolase n=1 Tax=Acinetobacter sp. WZC-1 TaxID=3459034 RepID=UPI00403E2367